MPCNDSASSVNIRLTVDERFCSYEFLKMTCSRPIQADTGLGALCAGKSLDAILAFHFEIVRTELGLDDDAERGFILRLELEALQAGITSYLGVDDSRFNYKHYQILSIEQSDAVIDIALVILPSQDAPTVKSCCSMKCSA